MDPPNPTGTTHPLLSAPTLIHQHFHRLRAELSSRFEDGKRLAGTLIGGWPSAFMPAAQNRVRPAPTQSTSFSLPFASLGQGKHVFDVALSSDHVARTLAGTAVYTVSNMNNEFVLVSDPNGAKSIGLLCFRREDAEAFLAQALARKKELRSRAKVVPITLDQVYMLKVEGIAFRFLPDPVQIRNALEMKGADNKSGFDGVPVFQSDLLVVKRKNKRYLPIFFQKEDLEKELSTSKLSRKTAASQHIMVGSLEDVLKKMERSEKNSGWDDLIFVPPGRSYSQHIQEVARA
ncbi:hypothetical protein V2J09_007536 [Rumex salicifolius]